MESRTTQKQFYFFILRIIIFSFHTILYSQQVLTPEGKPTAAWLILDPPQDLTNPERMAANSYAQAIIDSFNLNAVIIDSATLYYNCHGYAWCRSENIGIGCAVNFDESDGLSYFWTDNEWANDNQPSYLSASENEATHAHYTDVSHSVRKIQNSYPQTIEGGRDYVSKWGICGLYQHAKNHDPYHQGEEGGMDFKKLKTIHYGTLKNNDIFFTKKTWIGAGGITHTITDHLTIPTDVRLTIKQGSNVQFVSSKNLTVSNSLISETDLIIPSSSTLTVNSGSQLNFSNGKSLTINGTLSAVGTSASKITFNFNSPSSTYQNGIKFNSGSGGTLSYCNIRNAYHGVKCHSSLPTIQYCDIYNNGTGIYIYNAGPRSSPIHNNNIYSNSANGIFIYNSTIANVYENTVTDNSECGIYCTTNGTPYLWENIITDNNQAGVYCIINSRALFGDRHCNPGYNLITQNYTGVTCGLESYVRIGTASLAGHNSIHDNTGYEVTSTYDSYVKAEYNWWNRYPPSYPNYYYAGDFYTYMGGTIDYDPSLTYDPIAERMAKTVAYKGGVESNPQAVSASFLDSELNEALDYLFEGKYEEAIAIYVRRLNNETDKSRQKYLLSCIAECYELSGKDGFIDYLNNDVHKNLSRKDELYAKTLELENYVLMRAGNIQKAIDNYLIMKNEFTDNDIIQKNALFNLGYLHYM
ncbi:MAG: right-handed parallel beta-helix repeat-containing protein, partial [Candidatus Neomarinimicrobiota bacterium]